MTLALDYDEYLGPILVATVATICVILAMILAMSLRKLGSFSQFFSAEVYPMEALDEVDNSQQKEIQELITALEEILGNNQSRDNWMRRTGMIKLNAAVRENDTMTVFETLNQFLSGRAGDCEDYSSSSDDEEEEEIKKLKKMVLKNLPPNSERRRRVERSLPRLNRNAKLQDIAVLMTEKSTFRWNRSKAYSLLLPLVSIFYFLPSIQFAFLSKRYEKETGSQDICYHNFECSHHWGSFTDFNHVISNISYVLYGLGFIILVRMKSKKINKLSGLESRVLQQFSLFYAMGFTLIFQGLLSVCYHICPTNYSLQFDTFMMYVMCLLCLLKLYQFRHPDGNINAYGFSYFVASLLVFQMSTLYTTSSWIFGLFITFYVLGTIYVAYDCYYVGIGRLDYLVAMSLARKFLCHWKQSKWTIIYKKRLILALSFCLINFSLAIYFTLDKIQETSHTINEAILPIIGVNLMIYLIYYLTRKTTEKLTILKKEYKAKIGEIRLALQDNTDGREKKAKLKFSWTSCLSFSLFCGIISVIFALWGGYYYTVAKTTHRSVSPARSRHYNQPCKVWDFYDNHDMWHFLSASAIFFALSALLSMEDDFINVPKKHISIF